MVRIIANDGINTLKPVTIITPSLRKVFALAILLSQISMNRRKTIITPIPNNNDNRPILSQKLLIRREFLLSDDDSTGR